MKIVKPSFKVMRGLDRSVIPFLEECGRVCYKSEDLITDTSATSFVKGIVKSGHESVIEHAHITVRIIGNRAMSHQIVRHRIASYSQESQRYVNYSKNKFGNELTFIDPMFSVDGIRMTLEELDSIMVEHEESGLEYSEELDKLIHAYAEFEEHCNVSESRYMDLVGYVKAEEARDILPNSCKTEMVMTCNLRSWRHFFAERAVNKRAQYQIRYIAQGMLKEFNEVLPEIFSDLVEEIDSKEGWII